MGDAAKSPLQREIAGALAWWRDAGVDVALADTPRRWLGATPGEPEQDPKSANSPVIAAAKAPAKDPGKAPGAALAGPAAAPQPMPDEASWPGDLAAFAEWWLREPWLDAGRTQGRVAPRGRAGARLMVLVPQPEAEDGDTLLSGPQGRLLAAMLAAMGIGPDDAYIASALPRHTPMADWAAARDRGLGKVLAHHVALVAPQRVLALGDTVPSLLGHDPTNSAAPLTEIAVGGAAIPLLAARSLEGLLVRAGWKADVWRKWLAWTR